MTAMDEARRLAAMVDAEGATSEIRDSEYSDALHVYARVTGLAGGDRRPVPADATPDTIRALVAEMRAASAARDKQMKRSARSWRSVNSS